MAFSLSQSRRLGGSSLGVPLESKTSVSREVWKAKVVQGTDPERQRHRIVLMKLLSLSPDEFEPKLIQVVCRKRDRELLPYHVTVVTPPPRNLGVHPLPTIRAVFQAVYEHRWTLTPVNTQCGETVTVKGDPYIVSGVTYQYQLRRGKYEPRQKRLDVQSTGRYLLNLYLDTLLESN